MTDEESVLARLKALQQYVAELDFYAQFDAEELSSDFTKYRAVQHSLQRPSRHARIRQTDHGLPGGAVASDLRERST